MTQDGGRPTRKTTHVTRGLCSEPGAISLASEMGWRLSQHMGADSSHMPRKWEPSKTLGPKALVSSPGMPGGSCGPEDNGSDALRPHFMRLSLWLVLTLSFCYKLWETQICNKLVGSEGDPGTPQLVGDD